MSTFTTHFQISLPDFNVTPWHTQLLAAFTTLDSIMYGLALTANVKPWINATNYIVGNLAMDTVSGTIYMCLVIHTSAATGIFSADRTLHPTYWQAVVAS